MTLNEKKHYILGMKAVLTSLQSSLSGYEDSLRHRSWYEKDHNNWTSCVECLEVEIEDIQRLITTAKEENEC